MDSEAFVTEILKKHGESLDQTSSLVKVDGLAVLATYLRAVLPGFQKVAIQKYSDDDDVENFARIIITFCPHQKFYVPETHYLKFIYNGAVVQCSSNLDELLEAIELAAKYSTFGIGIDNKSTVFFKDNSNFHGDDFYLFKQGITTKDIIAIAANPPAPETFAI